MFKRSSTELTYEISEQEKEQAQKVIESFEKTIRSLTKATEYLNIMHDPFKKNPAISTDQILKYRAAIRRFRDTAIDNFNQVKIDSFRCISNIQIFTSDTKISKLMKTFVLSIENLEKKVNSFSYLFIKLKSETFVQDIINSIDDIKKESDQIKKSIDERIKPYIETNIIGDVWVQNMESKLNEKIDKKKSIILEVEKGK
jgi:molecular chaperone GrpE (heat shock protein)